MSILENKYQQSIGTILPKKFQLGKVDLVIGIPVLSAEQDPQGIISILEAGLSTFYPDIKSLFVCLSCPQDLEDERGESSEHPQDHILVARLDKALTGRGWAVRGLMDIARKLSADLLVVEPSLLSREDADTAEGLTPDWIRLMYQPIRDNIAQYVLPRFTMSPMGNNIGTQFVFPLMASLFNVELKGTLDAGMMISNELLVDLADDLSGNYEETHEYGLNYWLIARILEMKVPVAEVYLGIKPRTRLPVNVNYLFSQAAHVIFKSMEKSQQSWLNSSQAVKSALLIGQRESRFVDNTAVDLRPHISQFMKGYNQYYEAVWSRIYSENVVNNLIHIVRTEETGSGAFVFPTTLWAQVVYETLIAYHFITSIEKDDLIYSLYALYEGRLAGYFTEILSGTEEEAVSPQKARISLENQVDTFISRKIGFQENWLHHREALQPFLPEVSYWEYIPGIPIILPHMVKSNDRSARVNEVYEQLLKEYSENFKAFIQNNLQLTVQDGYEQISQGIKSMVTGLEAHLSELLFPENLHTTEGTQKIIEKIISLYPAPQSMSLKAETAAKLLMVNQPRNLITLWGYADAEELLHDHDPLNVLALTPWSEPARYGVFNTEWLRTNLKPDDFEMSPILPVVVDYTDFPALMGMPEASNLDHLSSRVVVSNLRDGSGGEFPKIRFLTTTLKRIAEAEQHGKVWETFVRTCGEEEFGEYVINSIGGHWGMSMFSAHNIFDNTQQIVVRDKLLDMAEHDWGIAGVQVENAKRHLARMANAYHLGVTLPDGVYVTCCIWSWASYSSKGGKGIPTPLSSMVERRWFNSELFSRLYERIFGERDEILPIIIESMGKGKLNLDLAAEYLGAGSVGVIDIVEQKPDRRSSKAGKMIRSPYNPILAPIADHSWENKYVLNCGVIRVNGEVYIFYRAVGDDGISRIGLAITKDGFHITQRYPEPVFSPEGDSEKEGCEDPRLIALEGRVYMLYTAYDGITPQIAMASISEEDMAAHNWSAWHRDGLLFPGFPNKDAVMFPERYNGKIVLYHRITPSIWITYTDTFETPWPRKGHSMILGTRSGMFWDAVKIGGGAPPIKTLYGWLHIYHGVDYAFCYRLGVFLTDLNDPARLLYRSPNPTLEPETSYEVGVSGSSWVPNVVFTCGAVPTEDKYILDEDDEILIYYGGADTVIGVATATVKDLLPERYRQVPKL